MGMIIAKLRKGMFIHHGINESLIVDEGLGR